MGAPSAASIVLIPLPFSDLSRAKRRHAVVLASAGRGDWILCQITSNPYGDERAVALKNDDFASGSLHRDSFSRPAKLFTANENLILDEVGRLSKPAFDSIIDAVCNVLREGR